MKLVDTLIGAVRRAALTRGGQVAIPAVFIVPTLFMFVYLLFETAKLSREKIRHQFAVDSAAFIEMSGTSDFLNRTAYVNGAFPYRIFREAFACNVSGGDGNLVPKTDDTKDECLYALLYNVGAFPIYGADDASSDDSALDSEKLWKVAFAPRVTMGGGTVNLNTDSPSFPDTLVLFEKSKVTRMYLGWEAANSIFNTYATVYMLLGDVQSAQKSVYEKLTERFNFYRKSYYLNTGECQDSPDSCGENGLTASGSNSINNNKIRMKMNYIQSVYIAARKLVGGMDPLRVVETDPPVSFQSPGLFQLSVVQNKDALSSMAQGLDVYQDWEVSDTYFAKASELKSLAGCQQVGNKVCVHARIAVQCPRYNNGNNCVWPNPTPKYQTRLYP